MNLDLFADLGEVGTAPTLAAGTSDSLLPQWQSTAPEAGSSPMAVPAVHFGLKARQWSEAAIEELAASGDAKTRLKNLKADSVAYAALVHGVLMVAWRKSTAYQRARTELPDEAFSLTGWLLKDPELARATELLTRSRLAVNELEMLPHELHPEFA